MGPDDGREAANDAADTVDVDAAGADTIDRTIGGPERPGTPPPPSIVPVHTTATRGVAPRRRKGSSVGAFAATQAGLGVTREDETTDVVPPVVPVTPGTVLAGRYHVKDMVGQGGMGTVYAAHDADLDEDVALKVLRADLARDDAYRQRLRAEVRIARRVSHPNVCRVHDLGVAGDLVFVTMEMVHGRTLRQLLAEMRAGRLVPFDLAQVVDVLVQVGSALTAAHRAGVIHRDVKPDNVILTDGRAVLTDFGVATRTAERADLVAGTPAYLAPEVLRHEPFDHKVDVYALAVVAYELLTGRTPFAARTIEAATVVAASRPPYPELPAELATPEIRVALDRVLARALAPDPLLRTPAIDRFTEAFAVAARTGAGAAPAVPGLAVTTRAGTAPGDTTPAQPSERRPTGVTDPGSISGSTLARRPEVRVATALVWRAPERTGGRASSASELAPSFSAVPREVHDTASGAVRAEGAERIVVDAGGALISIVPGELVALFGVPRSGGDDADRAARAALAVVAAQGGRAALDTTRVLLRPGVAELAGPEVAIGAAALVALAEPGTVIASAAAARQLVARFECAPAESTGGRRVLGVRASAVAVGIETYRAAELAAIDAHLERAFRERTPVFVDVRGPAGAGKTRLREAMVAAVAARREVDWLVAVGSPIGAPAPLATVAAASREWYDAATGGGAITDPARRYNAARRWLEARATRRPVVIIIEDVQWADPSTHALLEHLRAGLDDVPVAVVTFSRVDGPGPAPALGVDVVMLGPLADAAAAQLARSVAPGASAAAIAGVVARGGGIPFFLEELARELADGHTSSLPTSIEAVIQARLDHLPEAASHVALAGAVIGRAFWRRAVGALAGIDGAELDEALAELVRRHVIAPTAPVTVEDDRYEFTQGLVRDVAYQRIPPRDRRQFHAAVATWLDTHATADRSKDDIALVLDAAHHREQSGDTASAAAAYRRAGERCLAVYAFREAAAALERAVALSAKPDPALREALGDALSESEGPAAGEAAYKLAAADVPPGDAPTVARLGYKLGLAAARRGDSATAIDRYRAALAVVLRADRDGSQDGSQDSTTGGAGAVVARPDRAALAPWAEADPRTASALLGGLGWTLGYQLGRVEEGHPLCERSVALLEGTPHRRELARALSRLGGTYMRACRFADQLRTNQRNLDLARELGDLDMQMTAHINLGVVHGLVGAIDAAVADTAAARALAARLGAAPTAGLAASNLGGLLLEQGKLAAAEALLDEALTTIERTGNTYVLCETFQFLARLAAARGDLPVAHHHAERSRALAEELGSPLDAAVATRPPPPRPPRRAPSSPGSAPSASSPSSTTSTRSADPRYLRPMGRGSIALAALAALAPLAGCGAGDDPAGGPVDARYMANGDATAPCGAARLRAVVAPAGSTVVFHTPSGAVQDVLTVDESGYVAATAWPCTDITVAVDRSQMITVRRALGDVVLGRYRLGKDPAPHQVAIAFPPFAGAELYTFSIGSPCTATTWGYASPATLLVSATYGCMNSSQPIVAIARGHGGDAVAFATAMMWTDDDGDLVAEPIRAWRTDLPTATVIVGAPAGWSASYRFTLAYQQLTSIGEPRTLYVADAPSGSAVRVPRIGDELYLELMATGASNTVDYGLEMAPPVEDQQADLQLALPYLPITQTVDRQPRPAIAWSLQGSEIVYACAYWAGAEPREWCVVDDPEVVTSIAFPALPPSLEQVGPPTSTGLTFRRAELDYDQWVASLMMPDLNTGIFGFHRIYVGDDPEHTSLPIWFLDP